MGIGERAHRRRRLSRPIADTALLGALVAALVVVALLLGSGLFGQRLPNALREWGGPLPRVSPCTVETAHGEVGLDRDQAQRATTAVALHARGQRAPDTSDIDGAALQRLAEGPPGDAGASLACRGAPADELAEQQPAASGLTPRAERLLEEMTAVFGEQSLGGFAPGGVDHGHMPGSTHYEGRAIDIFFRPVTEEHRRQGWLLAHWLVAHADELEVQYVIFDDRVWSVHRPDGQWRQYRAPDPGNEILRHLDHVHVDVLRGGTG